MASRLVSSGVTPQPCPSALARRHGPPDHRAQRSISEQPQPSVREEERNDRDWRCRQQGGGPGRSGIGDYDELEKILPTDYHSLLTPKETQQAIFAVKHYIEENLCKELNLMMVQVPLIVDVESGVNDMLDRDGSRTPIQFHISNDHDKHPIDAQVVQAATKWKRVALKQFGMKPGEGICTDMRAVRKDYFLDHDHSCYVDQWDWERVITRRAAQPGLPEGRRPEDLEGPQGRRDARPGAVPAAADGQVSRPARRARRSSTPRRSWRCTRTCRASSARRRSCRSTRPSSSSASAGRCTTAIRTRCAPPTTTTGSPRRSPRTGSRCTA